MSISLQQIIALVMVVFFIGRLITQRRQQHINGLEFMLWSIFWLIAAAAVILLPRIDVWVRELGFSATGIDVLLYFGVAILFYGYVRLRLTIARLERDITTVVRSVAHTHPQSSDNKSR